MNTAPVTTLSAETPRPDAVCGNVSPSRDGGNYTDAAIIARARRLIAMRDLHIARRDHRATAAILARLRAATMETLA